MFSLGKKAEIYSISFVVEDKMNHFSICITNRFLLFLTFFYYDDMRIHFFITVLCL